MAKSKKAAGVDGSDGQSRGDDFNNPRFDEILVLLSRDRKSVLESSFEPVWEAEDIPKGELGVAVGDRRLQTRGDAQWQVSVFERDVNGRGEDTEKLVGFADLVIPYGHHRATSYGAAQWDERKLMLLCRPSLHSAAETLRQLKLLRDRKNWRYGRDQGNTDEDWGVATDNDALRDIFEANGFTYVCTRWNDIDGWGRTDAPHVEPKRGASEGDEQWVLVTHDISGVGFVQATEDRTAGLAGFLQSVYLMVHAFPDKEFRVCGTDDDAAMEGLRLLMGTPMEERGTIHWETPIQLCRATGIEIDGDMPEPVSKLGAADFEKAGLELTKSLRDRGTKLDQEEVQRLEHSWPSLLYHRSLAAAMAEAAGRMADRSTRGRQLADRDDIWKAAGSIKAWQVATAVLK